MKANIHYDKDRKCGKIRVNDEVDVAQADIVVQDGVIHKVDEIILPPKLDINTTGDDPNSSSVWDRMKVKIFGSKDRMPVEELIERFQPYISANN